MSNFPYLDYELHKVAGTFLLGDMKQSGENYIKPIEINEVGADIFSKAKEGKSEEEIAEFLKEEYGIDFEEALSDVKDFIGSLNAANR